MTTPDPLKDITRALRQAVADAGDVDALPPGRDEAIERLAEALRTRGRVQRRQRFFRAPAFAAAAVLLVGGGGAFAVHRSHRDAGTAATAPASEARNLGRLVEPTGAVTAIRDGHSEAVAQGERLAEGTELRTGSSEASLDFESGTHVTLGGASRVRLVQQTARKRFALESGSFTAKVAKLGPDERFVVATPDAEVEVRGTMFRVSLVAGDPTCEGGTPTRLEVSEGVVVVTHGGDQVKVAAGEHWPACAATTAAKVAQPAAVASVVARATPPATHAPAASVAHPSASSRLAEQNDLYEDAMRRKRAGDVTGAVSDLDRLLSSYPGGPVAESAAAERMRLLAATNPGRARAAARDYLTAHPRGFARAEAEAIATGSP
ncbi:MAG TPA: FecR domain-containing protein [Labilithrix sp.]|nr:FecR domain-containing protein [Labilithrix sp.]